MSFRCGYFPTLEDGIILAIHDMKEGVEAPPALQSKTLSKLELLNVRPLPQVTFYYDIATAILRMEVVMRLEGR
jgi:hypothetical protein